LITLKIGEPSDFVEMTTGEPTTVKIRPAMHAWEAGAF